MHSTKCLESVLKFSYLVSNISNYQFPKTMFRIFLGWSWILIALAHTLIALVHTWIALAHTWIALTHLNSTEKLHRLYCESCNYSFLIPCLNPYYFIFKDKKIHFAVNSYSLSKHLSFDMLESIGEKNQFMVIKGLFGQKGAFFGVWKAKYRTFFGEFLFTVKIPFIWYAGIY